MLPVIVKYVVHFYKCDIFHSYVSDRMSFICKLSILYNIEGETNRNMYIYIFLVVVIV